MDITLRWWLFLNRLKWSVFVGVKVDFQAIHLKQKKHISDNSTHMFVFQQCVYIVLMWQTVYVSNTDLSVLFSGLMSLIEVVYAANIILPNSINNLAVLFYSIIFYYFLFYYTKKKKNPNRWFCTCICVMNRPTYSLNLRKTVLRAQLTLTVNETKIGLVSSHRGWIRKHPKTFSGLTCHCHPNHPTKWQMITLSSQPVIIIEVKVCLAILNMHYHALHTTDMSLWLWNILNIISLRRVIFFQSCPFAYPLLILLPYTKIK